MDLISKAKQTLQDLSSGRKSSDLMFILWAGLATFLSYSFVYAIRKPFTASPYDGLTVFGMDYKVVLTIVQIFGYVISKFVGIKLVSELKKENRLTFFFASILSAEFCLVLFGLVAAPYNIVPMFFHGLSLGCMWGVIFSYIEGRRLTDLVASVMCVSLLVASGTAKSIGLWVMKGLGVDQFWMPAIVGGAAVPLLALMAWLLQRLPQPTKEDVDLRCERVPLDGKGRKELFMSYLPLLATLFGASFLITVLRDVKEDFLVNIIDMSQQSSWLFAKVDTIVSVFFLVFFGAMTFWKNNFGVLATSLGFAMMCASLMSFVGFNCDSLNLDTTVWLFVQDFGIYAGYLAFQGVIFDRLIACVRMKGNVGFFIIIVDFLGYVGSVSIMLYKEFFRQELNWHQFYNNLSGTVGIICTVSFAIAIYIIHKYSPKTGRQAGGANHANDGAAGFGRGDLDGIQCA